MAPLSNAALTSALEKYFTSSVADGVGVAAGAGAFAFLSFALAMAPRLKTASITAIISKRNFFISGIPPGRMQARFGRSGQGAGVICYTNRFQLYLPGIKEETPDCRPRLLGFESDGNFCPSCPWPQRSVSVVCRKFAMDCVSLRGYSVLAMASACFLIRRCPPTRWR